jgi:predicted RNA-binding protein
MCLDQGSFLLVQGDDEASLEHVATLLPGAAGLKLVDVYGQSREIPGTIEEIDLLNRRMVLA